MILRRVAFALLAASLFAPTLGAWGTDPEDDPGCVNVTYAAVANTLEIYPALGNAIGLFASENVGRGAAAGLLVFPEFCHAPELGPVSPDNLFASGTTLAQSAPAAPPVLPLP